MKNILIQLYVDSAIDKVFPTNTKEKAKKLTLKKACDSIELYLIDNVL